MRTVGDKPSTLRVWLIALRPFSFTASVLPIVLGSVLALEGGGGGFLWGRFLLLLAAVILLHASANLLNDYYDYLRGIDETVFPVSGAVVRGWLEGKQVQHVAIVLLLLGLGLASVLIWMTGWGLLGLVLIGVALAVGYTRRGICLKYLGLGDPAILLGFGVLPVLSAWWVQSGYLGWRPVVWSIPPGLFAVAILHANNWRDHAHDAAKGCRTLAVRLGEQGRRRYWQGLLLLGYCAIPVVVGIGHVLGRGDEAPIGALLPMLTLPAVVRMIRVDWSQSSDDLAVLDAKTAKLHSVFTLLLAAGFFLSHLYCV